MSATTMPYGGRDLATAALVIRCAKNIDQFHPIGRTRRHGNPFTAECRPNSASTSKPSWWLPIAGRLKRSDRRSGTHMQWKQSLMSAVAPYNGAWSGASIAHTAALDGSWLRSGLRNLRLTILVSMMRRRRPPFLRHKICEVLRCDHQLWSSGPSPRRTTSTRSRCTSGPTRRGPGRGRRASPRRAPATVSPHHEVVADVEAILQTNPGRPGRGGPTREPASSLAPATTRGRGRMAEPWYARRRRAASRRGSRTGTPRGSPRWAAGPAHGNNAMLAPIACGARWATRSGGGNRRGRAEHRGKGPRNIALADTCPIMAGAHQLVQRANSVGGPATPVAALKRPSTAAAPCGSCSGAGEVKMPRRKREQVTHPAPFQPVTGRRGQAATLASSKPGPTEAPPSRGGAGASS